ncbi:MAG TPA: class D sortase [Vicinamibacterales bacterium]|nr:class D sortase [Vicinamibacterales bacterium]
MQSRAFWNAVEAVAWAAGVVCLVYVVLQYRDGVNGTRDAMREFTELKTAERHRPESVDVSLWSEARIKAWQSTRDLPGPSPLAVLRIPRIHLEVPILEGTDEVTLNRGTGHIEDTAMPGADGNIGIAGHRDGFFRVLRDVAPGDAIELESVHSTAIYRIERTWIVRPDDVSVLDPTTTPSLTLVTCYPFYFVGSAPERYIVRAVRSETRRDTVAAHRLLSPQQMMRAK